MDQEVQGALERKVPVLGRVAVRECPNRFLGHVFEHLLPLFHAIQDQQTREYLLVRLERKEGPLYDPFEQLIIFLVLRQPDDLAGKGPEFPFRERVESYLPISMPQGLGRVGSHDTFRYEVVVGNRVCCQVAQVSISKRFLLR